MDRSSHVCVRAGLPTGARRRLPPDVVWYHARHLTPPSVGGGCQIEHAYASLGFCGRLPARRTNRRRSGILPTSAGPRIRDHRQRWATNGVQNRETSVRHGTGRPTLAAYLIPMARGVRFYPTLAGEQRVQRTMDAPTGNQRCMQQPRQRPINGRVAPLQLRLLSARGIIRVWTSSFLRGARRHQSEG